jgi:hypothetical protein
MERIIQQPRVPSAERRREMLRITLSIELDLERVKALKAFFA